MDRFKVLIWVFVFLFMAGWREGYEIVFRSRSWGWDMCYDLLIGLVVMRCHSQSVVFADCIRSMRLV